MLKLRLILVTLLIAVMIGFASPVIAQHGQTKFKVLGFYTAKNDPAHISFVHEANKWLSQQALRYNFTYDSTNQWDKLNKINLAKYKIILFLDTRPDSANQRAAFQQYMEDGGSWIGFHFSGFALTPSDYPQNWDWYHNKFLGSGAYKGNTWKPTSAVLRIENAPHPVTKNLPETFKSSPNEWYSWEKDLRKNPDITILLSIDPESFPLGTGPKAHEIWHEGYFPVVWTNKNYKMLYVNMGHNDIDYANKTNKTLSFTFGNQYQDQLIINAILWLGEERTK